MSELHVRQIKATLEKLFSEIIDVSDVESRPSSERVSVFLTRSLASFSLMYLANIRAQEAAAAVVDGFKDNGIDAIYYHPSERILYIVQSKWRHDGVGSVDRGEMQKFLKGFRDLVNARWDRFNAKLVARTQDIEGALNDASTRIVLVVVYTGQEPLSKEVAQDLKDAVDEINDTAELVSSQVLRQVNVYAAVAQGTEGAPIDVEIALYDWGQVREPYGAFYGQVSAADVAAWFAEHQGRLFSPNIRMFLGSTEVNGTIVNTLLSAPQDFWYFNNGITALCRTIKKKPIGGNTRETGFFECHDLRIVNGAQTVGAIASAASRDSNQAARARVPIRLIALDQCPADFDKQVTRYNNTQNRIDRRDFVALDLEQERIRSELQLDGVTYAYKSGESFSGAQSGFDLVEATVARACIQRDASLSVQCKREIGKLWEDIEKAPYKVLFNPSVSGPSLWRAVQIVRVVEDHLAAQRPGLDGRTRLLSVHGNRFITHLVLNCLPPQVLDERTTLDEAAMQTVRSLAGSVLMAVLQLVNDNFPDAYLASLFKNASKCQQLKGSFRCPATS